MLILEIIVPVAALLIGLLLINRVGKPLLDTEAKFTVHHFMKRVEHEHVRKGGTVDPHPPAKAKDGITLGKRYMDHLSLHNPPVYCVIVETHLDPTVDDNRIPAFKEKVIEIWWGTENFM